MAQMERAKGNSNIVSCDAYFETIQSRKKLSRALQESLTAAFETIPVSSFPQVPGGKVIEISENMTVADAVKVLSESNILSAPVTKPEVEKITDWSLRYTGIIDHSAIILWVLESADLAATALSATSATATRLGAGAVGSIGSATVGATDPAPVTGLTDVAMAGGAAADKGAGKDAPTAASQLGDDFYKMILQEEPFKSTKVKEILQLFRYTPFLPVSTDCSMLTIMLLLSKYRMRNVPVIEPGKPSMKNFITQSAVVNGLDGCRGRDWFDSIAAHPISDLGLPFMSHNQVVSVESNTMVLEAFKRMKDNQIGGLPVVEGPKKKIVANMSMRFIRYLLLKPEIFSNFRHLTILNFIKTITSRGLESGKVIPPVTCKPNAKLGEVIRDFASKSVHRIYVVGEEDEVVGVITLRDVISCFIYEPPNYFDSFGLSVKELLRR